MARKSNTPAPAARRPEVRAAVAAWLVQVRTMLGEIQRSAGALHREVTDNPDGEVARALAGNVESLESLAAAMSDADSYASDVHLTPEEPLPDPVAAARGGKDGA